MADRLHIDAFLLAARRHRLLDGTAERNLREALIAATPANPLEIDAWLAGNPILPTEGISRLRRLLPNARAWDDYLPQRPLAHLASGGMGDIWLASDAQAELVVIKTLRGELAPLDGAVDVDEDGTVWIDLGSGGAGGEVSPGSAMQRRIERESRITRQLSHPCIVRCRNHGITRGGNLFMVLDFHGSGDLFELIVAHGRLSETLALSLVEQVAAALEASHRLHLVHRDIKPGNIFLTADGGAKLADFGFARSTRANRTQLTVAGTVIGSPSCMSPEQVDGRADLDIRADLYAVGCVLFHAITGSPPFSGTVPDVLRSHCSVPPPALATLRPGVHAMTAAIVERCLRKDRESRYATPAELRRDLQAALAVLGVKPGTRVPLPERPASAASGRLALAALPTMIQAPETVQTTVLPPPEPPPLATAPATAPVPAASAAAPATATEPVPAGPDPLGDWLVLADRDTVVALYARPRLTMGKHKDASVDICLRNYPEEAHREACMRISRQHATVAIDAAGRFIIQDLGSANGTTFDGEPLVAGRPVAIAPGLDHILDIAQVVTLRVRAVPGRSAGTSAALVLTRSKNRPGLAYALVREEVSLGGPGADIILPGCAQGAAAWISRHAGRWRWRAGVDLPWQPLAPGSLVDGGPRRWTARRGDPDATL